MKASLSGFRIMSSPHQRIYTGNPTQSDKIYYDNQHGWILLIVERIVAQKQSKQEAQSQQGILDTSYISVVMLYTIGIYLNSTKPYFQPSLALPKVYKWRWQLIIKIMEHLSKSFKCELLSQSWHSALWNAQLYARWNIVILSQLFSLMSFLCTRMSLFNFVNAKKIHSWAD